LMGWGKKTLAGMGNKRGKKKKKKNGPRSGIDSRGTQPPATLGPRLIKRKKESKTKEEG